MNTTLSWFPLDADEWLNRVALLSMEERGALLTLVLTSWNASVRGEEPGTLPADDETLVRLVGPVWRRVRRVIREHFLEHPDNPTRIRCDWLAALYRKQLALHQSAVERGKLGGWTKGRKRPTRNTSATSSAGSSASAELKLTNSNKEVDPVGGSYRAPHTGGVDASDGRDGATAASPPAPPEPSDPPPVSDAEVLAWASAHDDLHRAIEAEVEALLDADNTGWRERPNGMGVRTRLVTARLAEAFRRDRPFVSLPLWPVRETAAGPWHPMGAS